MRCNIVVVAIMALAIAIMLLPGCTTVSIERPDTVTLTIQTLGSAKITDMAYVRNKDGIWVKVGQYANTPAGIPEIITATGSAITDVTTAGVSSAVETVISPNPELIEPDE